MKMAAIGCAALAGGLFLALSCLLPGISQAATIRNHAQWLDTDGNPIDCHEGALLRVGNTFYWHCRQYHGNPNGIYGAGGAGFRCGLNCYSSTDLEHWSYHGVCLPYPDSGFLTAGTWHRPRVIYNAATSKYVLWFFMFPTGTPAPFSFVVATADTPTGPFTVISGPDKGVSGDLATFLDQDGKGYLAWDSERNVRVTRLGDDFSSLTAETTIALSNQAGGHEGSSMAFYKGKYIVAGSGVAGLNPTNTTYAVADAPLGPYTTKGLMSEQNTWNSQISAFVYIAETDLLFAMNEQWLLGPDGKKAPAEQSTQLWLPVSFDPTSGEAHMQLVEEWDPWAGKPAPGDMPSAGGQAGQSAGGSAGADSTPQPGGHGGSGGATSGAMNAGGLSSAGTSTSSLGGGPSTPSASAPSSTAEPGCTCSTRPATTPHTWLLLLLLLGTALRRTRRFEAFAQ